MKILGISAYYHDSAAALVIDGKVIAAAQEERFTRKKHDPSFPINAIRYCLKEAGITIEDVDYITFYDKPFIKFERLLETYVAYAPYGIFSFLAAMPVWLKEKLFLKTTIKNEIKRELLSNSTNSKSKSKIPKSLSQNSKIKVRGGRRIPHTSTTKQRRDWSFGIGSKILFSEHHQSHAASAFFPSPYEKAAVLCVDGVGEWATTTVWKGDGNKLEPLWEIDFPHSLGLLYSAFTYYTGFKVNSGEYKVMGLAPYGEPKYVDLIFEKIIDVKEDGTFRLNMEYFNFAAGLTMTNKKFDELFGGPPRKPESEVTQKEMDLARSVQVVVEEIMLKLCNSIQKETGAENLCLAGGVALNCVANGRVLREGPFKDIWIQPAAGDAGGAIGSALSTWYEYLKNPRTVENDSSFENDFMVGSYLGPEYTKGQIKDFLESNGIPYKEYEKELLFEKVATVIDEGNVVGWFQGRMEFGPRSLGNRSIIGDPRNTKMQTTMNLKIKYRESFRPFAPAVLREDVSDYFELDRRSPYMLLVAPVKKERRKQMTKEQEGLFGIEKLNIPRSDVPAITHVDYSARVQTVDDRTNPKFHSLLKKFKEISGCSTMVNTSFNVRGEPIVCSPEDAYRCFMRTEMDFLVLGDFVLDKKAQPKIKIDESWMKEFELD